MPAATYDESPRLSNPGFVLQKYLLLHEQHEELTHHLDQIRPSRGTSTYPNSRNTSPVSTPALSPTLSPFGATPPAPFPRRHHRSHARVHARSPPPVKSADSSSSSLDTVWNEDAVYGVEAEEQRLSDVNEGIKRALTELLNCEAVRSDASLRMWVQCRLMETEKELRSGRRKRCAA